MVHIQIFNHHVQLPYVVLSVLEFIVLASSAYISVVYSGSREGLDIWGFDLLSVQYGLIFAVIMLLSTFAMGVYEAGVSDGFGSMLVRTVVSYCLLGALAMVMLYYLVPVLYVGRGALFGAVVRSLFPSTERINSLVIPET